jgi:2-amino-4-hydroxy-6-hydroxymethyldihydropteridine diphosphokinase
MNRCYLLIGGNQGNRTLQLETAVRLIKHRCGTLAQASHIYETAPWGKTDQAHFLNQVLELETSLTATDLLHEILSIEESMGRYREEKYGPRVIDIDILLFNHEIIDLLDLKVPHPALPVRRFALEPLNELAPHYYHPVEHKSIRQLLQECPDTLEVKQLEM